MGGHHTVVLGGTVSRSSTWWGHSTPMPRDVHVELENGWGPGSDGQRLHGVGHGSGHGRSFQLSFMSRSHEGYAYGQTTVNRLCRIVFHALDTLDALDVPLR